MTKLKGEKLISISATANEVYEIEYKEDHTLNILNHTDDTITVSDKEFYSNDTISANCLKIPAKSYYNGLKNTGFSTFISASTDGTIALVRIA